VFGSGLAGFYPAAFPILPLQVYANRDIRMVHDFELGLWYMRSESVVNHIIAQKHDKTTIVTPMRLTGKQQSANCFISVINSHTRHCTDLSA
jgi:hypothetical protein